MSKKTGCSSGEALYAQRNPLCPERIGYLDSPDRCKVMPGVCYLELSEPCAIYDEYIKGLEEVK